MRKKDGFSMGNLIEKDGGLRATLWKWVEESKLPLPKASSKRAHSEADNRRLVEFVFSHYEKFSPKIQKQIQILLQKAFRALGFPDDEARTLLSGDATAGAKRLIERGGDFERRGREAQAAKKREVAVDHFEKAAEAYRLALGLDAKGSEAHKRLAEILYAQGKVSEGRRHATEVLKLEGKSADLVPWLEGLKDPLIAQKGAVSFTAAALIQAGRRHSAVSFYLEMGRRAGQAGEAKKAESYLRKAYLTDELATKYQPQFDEKQNPKIWELYGALRGEGVYTGLILGRNLEDVASHRVFSAEDVLTFLDKNAGDPRVMKALGKLGLHPPPWESEKGRKALGLDDPGKAASFAGYSHSAKIARFHGELAKLTAKDKQKSQLLTLAADFAPRNADAQIAKGRHAVQSGDWEVGKAYLWAALKLRPQAPGVESQLQEIDRLTLEAKEKQTLDALSEVEKRLAAKDLAGARRQWEKADAAATERNHLHAKMLYGSPNYDAVTSRLDGRLKYYQARLIEAKAGSAEDIRQAGFLYDMAKDAASYVLEKDPKNAAVQAELKQAEQGLARHRQKLENKDRELLKSLEQVEDLLNLGKREAAEKVFDRVQSGMVERNEMELADRRQNGAELRLDSRLKFFEARLQEARDPSVEGYQKAQKLYQEAKSQADKALSGGSEKHATHLERAQIQHHLGNYPAVVADYKSALASAPDAAALEKTQLQWGFYFQELTRIQDTLKRDREIGEQLQVAKHPLARHHDLVRELAATEALRDVYGSGISDKLWTPDPEKSEAVNKSAKLQAYTSFRDQAAALFRRVQDADVDAALDQYQKDVEALIAKTGLDPQDVPSWVWDRVEVSADSKLKFKEAFFTVPEGYIRVHNKSVAEQKAEALQAIHKGLLLKWNQKQASLASAPVEKLYHESQALLLQDKVPEARLKMLELNEAGKALLAGNPKVFDAKPEMGAMYEQTRALLTGFTLKAVDELSQYNDMLKAQRQGSGKIGGWQPVTRQGMGDWHPQNASFLKFVKEQVKAGKIVTIDEAITMLQDEEKRVHEDFPKKLEVPEGYTLSASAAFERTNPAYDEYKKEYRPAMNELEEAFKKDPKATHPGVPTVRIDGGNFDIGDALHVRPLRIVIGPEGGTLRVDNKTYVFRPANVYPPLERVVLFRGGIHGEVVFHGDSKASYRHSLQQGPVFTGYNLRNWKADGSFKLLLERETKVGLEKSTGPDAERTYNLAIAKTMRDQENYMVAADLFEKLFASDLEQAKHKIPPEEKETAALKVRGDSAKIEKEISERLKKAGKTVSADELKAAVEDAILYKIEFKLRDMAYEYMPEIVGRHDKVAQEAWSQYNDMLDPNDEWDNLADSTWDAIKDEAVMMAVTLPLTLGVGAAFRAGIGGTTLALRLLSAGRVIRLATRTGILVAGSTVEGLMQTAISSAYTGRPFEWKEVGFNIITSVGFHGGNKVWGRFANKLGLGDEAIEAALRRGESVVGRKVGNFAGMMLFQTEMSASFNYLFEKVTNQPGRDFWSLERHLGEGVRQLAYHGATWGLNKATRNWASQSEQRAQLKAKFAEQELARLQPKVQRGQLTRQQAMDQALTYAHSHVPDTLSGKDPRHLMADHQASQASRWVENLGLDPNSPEGRGLTMALVQSGRFEKTRHEGVEAEVRDFDQLFRETIRLDPKSEYGTLLKSKLAEAWADPKRRPKLAEEFPELDRMVEGKRLEVAQALEASGHGKVKNRDPLLQALHRLALEKSWSADEVRAHWDAFRNDAGLAAKEIAILRGWKGKESEAALLTWALNRNLDGSGLQAEAAKMISGEVSFEARGGQVHRVEIPEGQRAAKRQALLDRLPELPADALHEIVLDGLNPAEIRIVMENYSERVLASTGVKPGSPEYAHAQKALVEYFQSLERGEGNPEYGGNWMLQALDIEAGIQEGRQIQFGMGEGAVTLKPAPRKPVPAGTTEGTAVLGKSRKSAVKAEEKPGGAPSADGTEIPKKKGTDTVIELKSKKTVRPAEEDAPTKVGGPKRKEIAAAAYSGAGAPIPERTGAQSFEVLSQVKQGQGVEPSVYRVKIIDGSGQRTVEVRLDWSLTKSHYHDDPALHLKHLFEIAQVGKEYPGSRDSSLRFTGETLGQGSTGTIFIAEKSSSDGRIEKVAVKVRTHGIDFEKRTQEFNQKNSDDAKKMKIFAEFDKAYDVSGLVTLEGGRNGSVMPLFAPEGSVFFDHSARLPQDQQSRIQPQMDKIFSELAKRGHQVGDVEFVLTPDGTVHLIDVEGVQINRFDPQDAKAKEAALQYMRSSYGVTQVVSEAPVRIEGGDATKVQRPGRAQPAKGGDTEPTVNAAAYSGEAANIPGKVSTRKPEALAWAANQAGNLEARWGEGLLQVDSQKNLELEFPNAQQAVSVKMNGETRVMESGDVLRIQHGDTVEIGGVRYVRGVEGLQVFAETSSGKVLHDGGHGKIIDNGDGTVTKLAKDKKLLLPDGTFKEVNVQGALDAEQRALAFVQWLAAKEPALRDFTPDLVARTGPKELVLGKVEGKRLDDLKPSERKDIPEQAWKEFEKALVVLGDNGFYHGDMNPQNILWDGKKLRLVDFGSAQFQVQKNDDLARFQRLKEIAQSDRPDFPITGHAPAKGTKPIPEVPFEASEGAKATPIKDSGRAPDTVVKLKTKKPLTERLSPDSIPKYESYEDPRVRLDDEQRVGKIVEYYSSDGTRDDLAAMTKRSDRWGADAKKFQKDLAHFEKAGREYFAAEKKFKSQAEADADPALFQKFRELAKLAENLENSPYHKLEAAHTAMLKDLGGELWPLENALAKIQFADLGANFQQGKTEASFDFRIAFTSLESMAGYNGEWKGLSTQRLARAEVTVKSWAKAEEILKGLRQEKVKKAVDGIEVTEYALGMTGELAKSPDGRSGTVAVTVKGPPAHSLELHFTLKETQAKPDPAVHGDTVIELRDRKRKAALAEDTQTEAQPLAAAAGAGDSIVLRAVTPDPGFEGRSGHDLSGFRASFAHDYYETVQFSDSRRNLEGGLLVPQAPGDPAPSFGMLWKVKSVEGDRLLLEGGRSFKEGRSTPVAGELVVKMQGVTRYGPGDEIRFIPPVAGGSGDAKPPVRKLSPPAEADRFIIGRDPSTSHVIVGGASVSRNHAMIARGADGQWYLLDGTIDAQGQRKLSQNGVKAWDGYAEVPVGREHWFPLAEGQLIRIGEQWIAFHPAPAHAVPKVEAPPPPRNHGNDVALPQLPAKWNQVSQALSQFQFAVDQIPAATREFDVFAGDPERMNSKAGPSLVLSGTITGKAPEHQGKFYRDPGGWRYQPNGEQVVYGRDLLPKQPEREGSYKVEDGDIFTWGYKHFEFSQGRIGLRQDAMLDTLMPTQLFLHLPQEVPGAARGRAVDFVERQSVPPTKGDVQILAGSVDFKLPLPIRVDAATEQHGEFARVTTQGLGYKKTNEDVVMTVRGPEGQLLMVDVDGMGGYANGDVAAAKFVESVAAEYSQSGKMDKTWEVGNRAVVEFNREQRKAFDADPRRAGKEEYHNAGAVAVIVELIPPKREGEAAVARFEWVGDARAMHLRPDDKGRLRWIYRTVDEGVANMPGVLRPGVDYAEGGAGKTLVGQLLPNANVVTNAIGTNAQLKVRGTQHGETPNPNDPTGASLVGGAYKDGIALQPKDWVILGSDGFWENFGRTEQILNILDRAGSAEDATRLLTEEAHWRMGVLAEAKAGTLPKAKSGRFVFKKPGGIYYIDGQGRWRKAEALEIDKRGKVFEPGGTKPVDHFKNDNFSLTVYQHNPNPDPTSKDFVPPLEGRFGHDPQGDDRRQGVYGKNAMEMKVSGRADGSTKDLQELKQGYGEKQAALLKEIESHGGIEGTARSYEAKEFPELFHLVLERGQPIETLPSAKGIRGKVEDYMYAFVVEVDRRFPDAFTKVGKQDPETGESFQIKGNDGKMKQNIPAMYRFAKRLLNQKMGLPVHGEASPRQQESVLGFVEGALKKKDVGTYEKAADALRREFRNLSPEFQKAYKAAPPALRSALLDALFDGKRFATFTDRTEAMNLVRFLGKTGYHQEFGLTADLSKQAPEYLLALGDLTAAINPRPGLVALIHSHPKLYVNRRRILMGHRDTLDLDSGREVAHSASILFSPGDLNGMVHDAERLSHEGVKLPGFLEDGVYRNWVQHSFGLSEAVLHMGRDGQVAELKILYGLYPDIGGHDNSHVEVRKQVEAYARKQFPGVKLSFEEVPAAQIEARIP